MKFDVVPNRLSSHRLPKCLGVKCHRHSAHEIEWMKPHQMWKRGKNDNDDDDDKFVFPSKSIMLSDHRAILTLAAIRRFMR